jgi:hypothetical protein
MMCVRFTRRVWLGRYLWGPLCRVVWVAASVHDGYCVPTPIVRKRVGEVYAGVLLCVCVVRVCHVWTVLSV